MGPWLMILLTILPLILEFLMKLLDKKEAMPPRFKAKFEKAQKMMREIDGAGKRLGCGVEP